MIISKQLDKCSSLHDVLILMYNFTCNIMRNKKRDGGLHYTNQKDNALRGSREA